MNREEFAEELKDYSIEELECIYEYQKDLYSQDELDYMFEVINKYRSEKFALIKQYLPATIECEKCGGPNEFEREVCKFCEHTLGKDSYFDRAKYLAEGGSAEVFEEGPQENRYGFQYVISFLIPLIGYIMGAIYLTRNDETERSAGKTCIVVAVVSSVIFAVLACVLVLNS